MHGRDHGDHDHDGGACVCYCGASLDATFCFPLASRRASSCNSASSTWTASDSLKMEDRQTHIRIRLYIEL